jgi:hypothetical protein
MTKEQYYYNIIEDINNHNVIKEGVKRIITDYYIDNSYSMDELFIDSVVINKGVNANKNILYEINYYTGNGDRRPSLGNFASVSKYSFLIAKIFETTFIKLLNEVDRKRKIEVFSE